MDSLADFVFINGSVLTVDASDRVCEAVAIGGRRILYVGDTQTAKQWAGQRTRIIDLRGRSLLPGFIDAHCHAGSYGTVKTRVSCKPPKVQSIEDLKRAIRTRAAVTPSGQWVLGTGYDQTKLMEKRHPTRWDLDEAAPRHKVFITRICGHVAVAGSLTLKELGIGKETPDPPGGRIERDAQGEPTGVLYEQAQMSVRGRIKPSYDELKRGLAVMGSDFLKYGITSAHDASGWNPDEIRLFQEGTGRGWIRLRLYFMVRSGAGALTLGQYYLGSGLVTGFGNEKLRLGPLKLMMDGSVGGKSAAMRKPYQNDAANFGILHMGQEELDRHVLQAHKAGYQIAIHAIGDRAIEMVLDSYEKALKRYPRPDPRHRIEHCGWLDQPMINRIHALGIVPALGVPFLYEHGDSYFESVGEEGLECVYPLRSLLDKGVAACLGSDAPVSDPNPLYGLYSAVTRKTRSGRTISPQEAVHVKQAVRAYTLHGAYASFEERLKGSIEIGKSADLIVLSQNILETKPEQWLEASVVLTMIDGTVVHESGL